MAENPEDQSDSQDRAGQGLEEWLKRLPRTDIEVPAAIDRAVLAHARAGLSRQSEARPAVLRQLFWGAAAAAVAIAAAVVYVLVLRGGSLPTATEVRLLSTDVDRDGVTDVVDALAFARRVRDGDRIESLPDVNGDGAVDALDAEALARGAVLLSGGST